jgi:hypothetical protein
VRTAGIGGLPFSTATASIRFVIRPWPEIERFYYDLLPKFPDDPLREALAAIGSLASSIADGPLASALFGWTSMHDLCIQQVDVEPESGSFLRISPQHDGSVEFRYHDTTITAHQWSRVVPAHGVMGRFEAFLDQLHWIAR